MKLEWTELTEEERQYFHMNWKILSSLYHRAESKEMSIKEAADTVSITWALLQLMTRWKEMWNNDPNWVWQDEINHMILVSVEVFKRSREKE
jgi:hypothetical protein